MPRSLVVLGEPLASSSPTNLVEGRRPAMGASMRAVALVVVVLGAAGCGDEKLNCARLDQAACEENSACTVYAAAQIDTSKGCRDAGRGDHGGLPSRTDAVWSDGRHSPRFCGALLVGAGDMHRADGLVLRRGMLADGERHPPDL